MKLHISKADKAKVIIQALYHIKEPNLTNDYVLMRHYKRLQRLSMAELDDSYQTAIEVCNEAIKNKTTDNWK